MSDASPYGTTQHADAARTTADALVGEHAGSMPVNAAVGASPATFSTAPYRPEVIGGRRASRIGHCIAKNDTCRAFPISGTDLCVFHTPGQARPDREEVDEPPEPA